MIRIVYAPAMHGQGPYRPQQPPPDPALAELAARGQQRRAQMMASTQDRGSLHLRTAVGAYRGSSLKRMMLVALVLSLLAGIAGGILNAAGLGEGMFLAPGFIVAFIVFMVYVFVPPLASPAAVALEHAWSMSLPFPFSGYFDVLSATPQHLATVSFDLRWQPGTRPPDMHLLQSALAAIDPGARLERIHDRGATIVTSPIDGFTGIKTNGVRVYRNHKFCGAIHGIVDGFLVTVHRSAPIAEVLIRRR